MADTLTRAARSRLMAKIRGNNLGPERRMAAALEAAGVPFARNVKVPGTPDFVIGHPQGSAKLAVFVHGCFWHCCPRHFKPVGGGRHAGWKAKFARNVARDRRVRRQLRKIGYMTAVVWEHSVKTAEQAAAVAAVLAKRFHKYDNMH